MNRPRPEWATLRNATIAVVGGVATFAAAQSYSHIHDLAATHAQTGWVGTIDPLSVDGLILAATLVMLQESGWRNRLLSHVMLWSGIGATVAANVLYGLGYTTHGAEYGILTAIISAWPAYSFIGGIHMVVGLVRHSGPDGDTGGPADPFGAAREAYERSVAGGEPLSARALSAAHGISRRQAGHVRATVGQGANGHAES